MEKQQIYTAEAIEKILPKKLKHFRHISGLTTAQVGAMLDRTPSAVTLWETGKALPDVNVLLKLCEIYKVNDINEFIETNEAPEIKSLTRSEQELITLWRNTPSTVKTSIKTILKQCNKE